MPYELRKQGDKFCVVNKETGDSLGQHDSRLSAIKQIRAIYAEGKSKGYHPDLSYLNEYIRYCNSLIETAQYSFQYTDSEHNELADFSETLIDTLSGYLEQLVIWRNQWYGDADSLKSISEDSVVNKVLEGLKGLLHIKEETQAVTLVKQADGRLRVMMRVSNMFKDRHGEIITQEAHKAYANYVTTHPDQMPEFWVWHTPGSRWGKADFVDFSDGFLSASGLVDAGQEEIAVSVARKDFGVSHGFRAISLNNDNFIDAYKSFEFSPLPRDQAANLITGVMLAKEKEMDATKRQKLIDIGIPEATVSRWETDSKDTTAILKELGIEFKDTEPEPEPAPVPDDKEKEPTLSEVLGQITRIANRMEAVEAKQKGYDDNLDQRVDKAVESVLSAAITPGEVKGHVATKQDNNEPDPELKKSQDVWSDELTDLLVGSGK